MNARSYSYTTPPTGHRLPEEVRLGAVKLQVADLSRSIAYYEKVIGLRVISRSDGCASLGAAESSTALVELHEKPGVNPVPRRGRLGLYHFAILLPTRADLGSFLKHLGDIAEYAGMADHLVSEALYLTDPDGLGIEVYADRPRDLWAVSGSTLEMASLHLNPADLIAAGSGTQWTGLPAGTVIGHVHLYVDQLATGDAFYHKTVGFDKVNLEFPGALFMSAGGYHHHLGTNTWAAQSPRATDDDARLLEWNVVLPSADDVNALASSLRENGFTANLTEGAVSTIDPWGSGIRFSVG